MAAEVSAITGSKRGLTTDLCTLRTSGKVIPGVCGEGEDAGGEEEAHEVAIDDEDYKNGEVGGGDSNTPIAYKYGEAGEGNA